MVTAVPPGVSAGLSGPGGKRCGHREGTRAAALLKGAYGNAKKFLGSFFDGSFAHFVRPRDGGLSHGGLRADRWKRVGRGRALRHSGVGGEIGRASCRERVEGAEVVAYTIL